MQINLKYKIEEKNSRITLDTIESLGYENAMELAYSKALHILNQDQESILSVMLLAWSHNLLEDSRNASTNLKANEFRILSSFYRKLAHKVYHYERENDTINMIPGFLQSIE